MESFNFCVPLESFSSSLLRKKVNWEYFFSGSSDFTQNSYYLEPLTNLYVSKSKSQLSCEGKAAL